MKNIPVYNVFTSSFNSNKIEIVNIFEYGQMGRIKTELKKLKSGIKKILDRYFNDNGKSYTYEMMIEDIKKIYGKNAIPFSKDFEKEFFKHKVLEYEYPIVYALNYRLKSDCQYYFWAKVEHEIVICDMFNHTQFKTDIYTQLNANWNIFARIVMNDLGIKDIDFDYSKEYERRW